MYRLCTRWDIGESKIVFATQEAGMAWLQGSAVIAEMAAEDNQAVDEFITTCFDEGVFSWEALEVIA